MNDESCCQTDRRRSEKLPRGQDLAYFDEVLRDLQIERADMMIKRLTGPPATEKTNT